MIINHSHCITITTPFIYETPCKSGSHTTAGLELLLYPPKPNTRMWPTVAEVTVSTYVVCLCVKVGVGAARCVDPHTQHCGFIRLASVSLHFDPVAINTSLLCSPSSSLLPLCTNGLVPTLQLVSLHRLAWSAHAIHTHTHTPWVYTDVLMTLDNLCKIPVPVHQRWLKASSYWTKPRLRWTELNEQFIRLRPYFL